MVALALPGPASAYRCGSTQAPDGAQATAMFQDCRAGTPARRKHPNKRGSMSSLTVVVLALAAALLLPIGARGIPYGVDPHSQDRPY